MIRIEKHSPHSDGQIQREDSAISLVLPFALRQKSRQQTNLESGEAVQLFLPHGTRLQDGDTLEATDGRKVRVRAAPETVLFVTAASPVALLRLAYHLGNRHTAIEIGENFLRLEPDPVLEELLWRLGGSVETKFEPFEPEPGAYKGGDRHDHADTEERALAQKVFHDHSQARAGVTGPNEAAE
jgi:urease accessory protein